MNPGYIAVHRERGNLLLHLLAVPLFWAGAGVAVLAVGLREPLLLLPAGALPLVSLALQGRGHRREGKRPEPFAGPVDFVRRILLEQFWTFPRFVLGGHWVRAWRQDR